MIQGFNPNQWPVNQLGLNRQISAVAAVGTTVTISQNTGATYSGLTLATMREFNPTINYNPNGHNSNGHEVQSYGAGDRGHILINVSGLSNITTGTVVSAIFKFYINVGFVNNTFNIVMRKMLAASDVTQATWNNRLTGTAWGTAGCLGDGVDRSPTVIGRGVITAATTGAIEISGSGLNQAVQDLINGTSTVYWFEIEDANDTAYNGDYVQFVSQSQTDGQRPTLTVTYTTPTVVTIGSTIAAIDSPDIVSIVAANWTTATIAVTDGADLSAISTTVTTGATISSIDSADIVVINASTWTNSAIAATDSPDIAAVSASVATSSSINTTDGADIAVISAVNWTSANIATIDSPDLTAIATTVTTGANINMLDGADVSAIIAANWTNAQIAVIDSADLVAIATTVGGITTASINAIDGSDLNAVTAANWSTASIAALDGSDITAIATAVTTGAAIAVVDGSDIVVINAANFTNASLALNDAPDLTALIAQVGSVTLANIAAIDAGDISAITTANWITAALALVDGADVSTISALSNALTQASIILIDGNDITLLVATTSSGQLLKPNSRQLIIGLQRIRLLDK